MPLYDFSCGNGHRFERFVPLARFSEPQECRCGEAAVRVISAPAVVSDTIEPRRGADGKMHDSLASYRRSLEPGGNPRGERYHELGSGESLKAAPEPKVDRRKVRDDIRAGIEDVKNGRVPPVVALGD